MWPKRFKIKIIVRTVCSTSEKQLYGILALESGRSNLFLLPKYLYFTENILIYTLQKINTLWLKINKMWLVHEDNLQGGTKWHVLKSNAYIFEFLHKSVFKKADHHSVTYTHTQKLDLTLPSRATAVPHPCLGPIHLSCKHGSFGKKAGVEAEERKLRKWRMT